MMRYEWQMRCAQTIYMHRPYARIGTAMLLSYLVFCSPPLQMLLDVIENEIRVLKDYAVFVTKHSDVILFL